MHMAFGWSSECSGEQTLCLMNFLEINRYLALTSYCKMMSQLNNTSSILGFFLWWENEESMF